MNPRNGKNKNKNKNKNKKATPKKRASKRAVGPKVRMQLSPCARDYLASLLDPFDYAKIPCMPDLATLLSRKVKVFSRGTLTTNSVGFGFLVMNPFRAASNTSTANQQAIRFTAGNAFVQSGIATVSGTAGVTSAQPNSEYSISATGTVAYRIISAGIRVRYAGTELNRGGRYVGLEEPAHYNLNGTSAVTILNYDNARSVPITNSDWFSVIYTPKYPLEMGYIDIAQEPNFVVQNTQAIGSSGETIVGGGFCLGMIVETAQPTTMCHYEAYVNMELIGDGVRGKTPSESDPVGFAAVMNALESRPPYLTREMRSLGLQSISRTMTALGNISHSN